LHDDDQPIILSTNLLELDVADEEWGNQGDISDPKEEATKIVLQISMKKMKSHIKALKHPFHPFLKQGFGKLFASSKF
jgi:hypothetical protein